MRRLRNTRADCLRGWVDERNCDMATKATLVRFHEDTNSIRLTYPGWTQDVKDNEGIILDNNRASVVGLDAVEKMPQSAMKLFALRAIVDRARDTAFIGDARGEGAKAIFEENIAKIVRGVLGADLPTGVRAEGFIRPSDAPELESVIHTIMPKQAKGAVAKFVANNWPAGQGMSAVALELVKRPAFQAEMVKRRGDTGLDELFAEGLEDDEEEKKEAAE